MGPETGLISLVFGLIDRGLRPDEIDAAMKKMIGPDWRQVPVATWIARFKQEGYLPGDLSELSVDALEALIIAAKREMPS